jgi:hypothetical protein
MSHRIAVPFKRGLFRKRPIDLVDVLFGVPRALWLADSDPPHLPLGEVALVACEGAARGVALEAREDGVEVRLFTCASRADVDLAVDLAAAFMSAGSGSAVNGEGISFSHVRELFAHYDEARRAAYVAWGPSVVAEHLSGKNALALSGPWASVTISAAELRAWREEGGDLATSVLEHLARMQSIARAAHRALDDGPVQDLHRLAAEETRDAACGGVAQWLERTSAVPTERAGVWDRLSALPPAILADGRVLFPALRLFAELAAERANGANAANAAHGAERTDGADRAPQRALAERLRALACGCACRDAAFAHRLAREAFALAQQGKFAGALSLFDAVVEWPRLSAVSGVAERRTPSVAPSEQSTWMCNALWAVQADNNKLPLDAARARRYVTLSLPYGPENPAIFFNAACVSFELGDRERALSLVSLAAHHRYPNLAAIAREPLFEPLRGDPRFAVAMEGRL